MKKNTKSSKATQKEEAKAKKYLDIAKSIIISLDTKGNITLLNKQGYKVLGYKEGSLIEKNWFETSLPKEIAPEIKKVFKQLMAGKTKATEHYENEVLTKAGEKKMIRWHNTLLKDDQGKITGLLSSGEDITEHKQILKELTKREEKFRNIFNASPEMLAVANVDGYFLEINQAFTDILGYSRKELLNKSFFDFIHPDDIKKTKDIIKDRLRKGKEAIHFTNRYRCKSGDYKTLDWMSRVDSRHYTIYAAARDVTHEKDLQFRLSKSQKIGHIGSWELSLKSGNLEWTDEAYNIFGIPVGTKLTYKKFLSIVHPDDRNFAERSWKAAIKGAPYDIEHRIIVKGKVKWVREQAEFHFDKKKKPVSAIGAVQDITKQKNAEQKLKTYQTRLLTVTESTPDCLKIVDLKGIITYANSSAVKNHGIKDKAKMIGTDFRRLIPKKDLKKYQEDFTKAKKGKTIFSEYTLPMPDGSTRYILRTYSGIKDEKGKITSIHIQCRNISAEKEAMLEVQKKQARFKALYEASVDAIMTLEQPKWMFTAGNPATIKMFGCDNEKDFTSRSPWQFSPKKQADGKPSGPMAKAMIMKAMKEGSAFFEWTHCRKDGENFAATVLLTRVKDGEKAFLQATVRDVSEEKRIKKEMQNKIEQMEFMGRANIKHHKRMMNLEKENEILKKKLEKNNIDY